MPKRMPLLLASLMACATASLGQEISIPQLDSAKAEFAAAKNKAESEYRDTVVRAYRQYLSRLAELLESASKGRNSEQTDRIKAEIAQVQRDLAAFVDRDYTIEYDFGRVKDLRDFVLSSAEACQIKDGELVVSDGLATLKTSFNRIKRVTIEGRIEPPSSHNFRIGVGPVHAILNWERAGQNHFRYHEALTAVDGNALTPGRNHEIRIFQNGRNIEFLVDKRKLWGTEGTIEGTVSVHCPGGTIRVKRLTVEGKLNLDVEVNGPSHKIF